jgi:hypothetical protein
VQFVAAFEVAALDQGAVEAVATVVSNLMQASTSQFQETGSESAEAQAAAEEQAEQRSSQLSDVVDTLTSAMASRTVRALPGGHSRKRP